MPLYTCMPSSRVNHNKLKMLQLHKASLIILVIALLASTSMAVVASKLQPPATPLHLQSETWMSATEPIKRSGLEGMSISRKSSVCAPDPIGARRYFPCPPPRRN